MRASKPPLSRASSVGLWLLRLSWGKAGPELVWSESGSPSGCLSMQINGGPSNRGFPEEINPTALPTWQGVPEVPEFRTHVKSLKTKSTAPFTREPWAGNSPKSCTTCTGGPSLVDSAWVLAVWGPNPSGMEESHRLPASWLELGSLIKSHLSLNDHMFVFAPFILGPWDFVWSG